MGHSEGAVRPPADPLNAPEPAEPTVLDPVFHQSVWKPWEDATGQEHEVDGTRASESSPGQPPGARMLQRLVVAAAVVVALGLLAALVVPRWVQPPAWRYEPLVNDMATTPEVAWNAEGGEACHNPSHGDLAILTDNDRVWALDLDSGRTRWSVELDTFGRVTCLPGADRVAVTMIDTSDQSILKTMLLSSSTGAVMAELPGDAIRQVIPLGSSIGLVDDTNMLRAVRPGALDAPLWSRQLQIPPGELEAIFVMEIDHDVVQLIYYANNNTEGSSKSFTLCLTTTEGSSPLWSQGSSIDHAVYRRFGDVITKFGDGDGGHLVSVINLQGQKLWDAGGDELHTAGSRFYLSSPSISTAGTWYTGLHQVDRRTGAVARGVLGMALPTGRAPHRDG